MRDHALVDLPSKIQASRGLTLAGLPFWVPVRASTPLLGDVSARPSDRNRFVGKRKALGPDLLIYHMRDTTIPNLPLTFSALPWKHHRTCLKTQRSPRLPRPYTVKARPWSLNNPFPTCARPFRLDLTHLDGSSPEGTKVKVNSEIRPLGLQETPGMPGLTHRGTHHHGTLLGY